jgi:hypothetical protein
MGAISVPVMLEQGVLRGMYIAVVLVKPTDFVIKIPDFGSGGERTRGPDYSDTETAER